MDAAAYRFPDTCSTSSSDSILCFIARSHGVTLCILTVAIERDSIIEVAYLHALCGVIGPSCGSSISAVDVGMVVVSFEGGGVTKAGVQGAQLIMDSQGSIIT